MKNFQPGGLRNRREDIGGRPKTDINKYAPKSRFDRKDNSVRPAKSGFSFTNKDSRTKGTKSFNAVCTSCKQACDVPFRPDGIKPVLCRNCFAKKSERNEYSSEQNNNFVKESQNNETRSSKDQTDKLQTLSGDLSSLKNQISLMEEKINEILKIVLVKSEVQATESTTESIPKAKKTKTVKETKAKKVVVKKVAKR